MADSAIDKTETVAVAEKEVVETPVADEEPATEEVAQINGKKDNNGKAAVNEEDEESTKDTENGDSTDAHEVCPVKRKSAGGDAPEGAPIEGASPEKKAKLEEKPTAEAEANGSEAKAAA